MAETHPFNVGDKIQFGGWHANFNRRFIDQYAGDNDTVTVTETVTEDDGTGTLVNYVRIAEDTSPDGEVAPVWNVNWFNPKPVTTAQEAPMTITTTIVQPFAVGDRVRVTDENGATIGNSGLRAGQTYVGATATVTGVEVEEDSEYDSVYTVEFDDANLSSFGTWTQQALVAVEETAERPTIDFSGSSRATAREYALAANSRLLAPEAQELLKRVSNGETVDAYALNEVLLAAMRAALTRHGASTARRDVGRKIAHLAHITQAVLENHAQGLPAYPQGERSPALAAAKREVADLTESIEGWVKQVDVLQAERSSLTLAASAERRRLCGEIDELRAQRRDLAAERARLKHDLVEYKATADDEVTRLLAVAEERDSLLADTVKERDTVALVLDYAMGMLNPVQNQRVLGYWDGVSAE